MANQLVESNIKVGQEIRLPKLETLIPQAKVHGRVITTRIVGVTFEGRQEVVAKLYEGDRIWLERELDNPFDPNAIQVCRNNTEQIGYLNRFLAQNISPYMDALGHPLKGKVVMLTGSAYDGYTLGVVIAFKLPHFPESKRRDRKDKRIDWDD